MFHSPGDIAVGYEVITQSQHDLLIRNAQADHSGTYECSVFGATMEQRSVQLAVVSKSGVY